MQKFFGSFLLENKMIEPTQLIEGLCDQSARLPRVARIVYDLKLMEPDKILNALRMQYEDGTDFKSAAVKNGDWSDEIETKVVEHRRQKRLPIGHLLVKLGYIDSAVLIEALEKYHKEQGGDAPAPSSAVASAPGPATVTVAAQPVAQPPAPKAEVRPTQNNDELAKTLDLDFLPVDNEIAEDYYEVLSTDAKTEIELLVMEWEKLDLDNDYSALSENLKKSYRIFHTIKGSTRFIRAHLTEKIMHEAEEILSIAQKFSQRLKRDDLLKMADAELKVIDVIWDCKDSIERTLSEEDYWKKKKDGYLKTLSYIMDFRAELDAKCGEVNLDEVAHLF